MAPKCLLDSSRSLISECSTKLISKNDIDADKIASYLTDTCISVTHLNQDFYLCENHLKKLEARVYNRRRKTVCDIPQILSSHSGESHKKDRYVTLPIALKVKDLYGILIPVGTSICKNCRDHLLKSEEDDESNLSATNEIQCTDNTETPPKRPRKNMPVQQHEDSSGACENLYLQESSQESDIQGSQSSITSGHEFNRLEQLNVFLSASGISPVKHLQGSLTESSGRTKYRYIQKAKQCMQTLFETMCPGEGELLHSEVHKCSENGSDLTLLTLVEIYKMADTWNLQRQILSIIVDQFSLGEVQMLLPEVTYFKYNKAKQHCTEVGSGRPVESLHHGRVKFEENSLEHFIEFITSGHVVKDLPFGERTLKLSSGEIVQIPSVIRSLAPTTIVSQYQAVCDEENIKPLGKSTLFKILDECTASVRKSIEGLDNYVMEGCRGFSCLESVLEQLGLKDDDFAKYKEDLQKGKRYLKSEFKTHLTKQSSIPDHCIPFALSSDVEPHYSNTCSHGAHDELCEDCRGLDLTLVEIQERVRAKDWDNKTAMIYTVEEAVISIQKWKAHIVRCRNQETARACLVEKMTDEDAIITCDWAMKYLPKKFIEGQVDWYAKRGVNWHIGVTLFKEQSSFSTETHIHLFDNPVTQDASLTTEIMIDLYQDVIKQHTNIKHIHFMSDNAGCYKSSYTLSRLHESLQEHLVTYDFCEAQNGKGPCDRRAAHLKSIIRRYINEGNDVTCATHMKKAIDRDGKPDLKVKVVSAVTIVEPKSQKAKIQDVSQLYNFHYNPAGLRVWKAYDIGEGKLMTWDKIGCPTKLSELTSVHDWGIGGPSRLKVEAKDSVKGSTVVFQCPVDGCTKQFNSQKAIDNHIILGKCSHVENTSVTEVAKDIYSKKLKSLYPTRMKTPSLPVKTVDGTSQLNLGWALKEPKKSNIFTDKQRAYMVEKFNIGKCTGRKVDPYFAAEEMRTCGKYSKDEFLSGQQICSYFSRLCQADKKVTESDVEAVKREELKNGIKLEVDRVFCQQRKSKRKANATESL